MKTIDKEKTITYN